MRILRTNDPVLAILTADLHLSLKPPVARAEEPNWFLAMDRSLAEIRGLQEAHDAVVLCAGDIFDKWNSPPELINWAIERLPHLYAIPGNHDLPHHRPDLSHRSAYGTLVRAGKITEVGRVPTHIEGREEPPSVAIYGREFEEDVPSPYVDGSLKVLLTHQYLWIPGSGHIGAPEDDKLSRVAGEFEGYDVVVVGDNHVPFDRVLKTGTHVINCGTLLRRKTSESLYPTRVGLLHASGKVTSHYLDTKDEVIREATEEQELADENEEITTFVEGLAKLEASDLNFREVLLRTMEAKKVSQAVREALLEALE